MVVIDKVIPCYKPVTVFAGDDTAGADDDGHNVPSGSSLVKVPTDQWRPRKHHLNYMNIA